jgi:hypothetical protein
VRGPIQNRTSNHGSKEVQPESGSGEPVAFLLASFEAKYIYLNDLQQKINSCFIQLSRSEATLVSTKMSRDARMHPYATSFLTDKRSQIFHPTRYSAPLELNAYTVEGFVIVEALLYHLLNSLFEDKARRGLSMKSIQNLRIRVCEILLDRISLLKNKLFAPRLYEALWNKTKVFCHNFAASNPS